MKDESEEARLIGDKITSNSMSYTDGPKIPLATAEGGIISTVKPEYEEMAKGAGVNSEGDENWRKGSGSNQSQDSELLNELMNCNGTTLMAQFHAAALRKVGFGIWHGLVIFVTGLALGAQGIQMFSLFFVLPSIDLEFCMVPGQKNLHIVLNVVGAAIGAMIASALAEVNGRKRTLLTCMLCMTLFSIVSAFMPTSGPFAMARFCASISAGGIFPIGATFVGEVTPGRFRARSIAVFALIGFSCAMFAGAGSLIMLPMTGEALVLEQREHFSSWHRYLLAMTLPSFISILGLFLLPESPRWLLDVGREVEALEIYQKIYCDNRTKGEYKLTELELPGMRSERHATPKSVLNVMANNAYQFIDSFASLFRSPYQKTTCLLMFIWFCTLFFSYGLTAFSVELGRSEEADAFHRMTVVIFNNTLENINLTLNIVNQNFENCQFYNVTFEQIFLSYVQFNNCTFLDSNFHGVKTRNTTFVNTFFNNVKFIDTNVREENFVYCVKNNTEIDRMIGGCDQQFDYNIFNKALYYANIGCMIPSAVITIWAGVALNRFGRTRVSSFCISFAVMMCCVVGFISIGQGVYLDVGVVQAFIFAALFALTVFTIEYYCTYLRCTALGLFTCFGHIGALIGGALYFKLPAGDIYIPAIMSIAGLSLPCLLTTLLKETTQLL